MFPFCLAPKLFFQVAQACDAKVFLKTERFLSRNWNHIFASAVSDNLRYFRIKHQNTGGEEGRCYFTGCAQKKLFLSAYHCNQCIVACSQCSVDGEVLSLLSDWKHSGEDTISASYLALTRRKERRCIQYMLETVFNEKPILAFEMRKRISFFQSCVRTRTFSFGLKLNFQREWEFSLVSD